MDFQRCPPVMLPFGGQRLPRAEVGIFDLMALLPQGARPLDGVLALSSLRPRVVTLRHAVDSLVIESPGSAARRRCGMHHLQMRLDTGNDGSTLAVFLRAEIGEQDGWLLLDSGNIAGTLVAPHVGRLAGVAGGDTLRARVPLAVRFAPGVIFQDYRKGAGADLQRRAGDALPGGADRDVRPWGWARLDQRGEECQPALIPRSGGTVRWVGPGGRESA